MVTNIKPVKNSTSQLKIATASRPLSTSIEINANFNHLKNKQSSVEVSKQKTGKSKLSVFYQRTIHEYVYGFVCVNCQQASVRISSSPKAPKYCDNVCSKIAQQRRNKNRSKSSAVIVAVPLEKN